MMFSDYESFFAASTGASAAFIGLLFVALSFIDSAKSKEKTKNWRRIIANSSYAQLVDIFFVSLVALTPDPKNTYVTGCVMAAIGLIASIRLLPQTIHNEKSGHDRPTLLGLIAVGAYVTQFVTGIGLLQRPDNKLVIRLFVLAIIILYAGALARAWEITGIKRR